MEASADFVERMERVEAEQVQTLTSRTIQTNHRESKGKIFDEKSFAKIGGHHQLLFRGSALKPQQAAFGKVAQSTIPLRSTFSV